MKRVLFYELTGEQKLDVIDQLGEDEVKDNIESIDDYYYFFVEEGSDRVKIEKKKTPGSF